MAKSGTINLLPQEEFEASIFGRILKWATGSFRIIVILTEMVVMGAFLSRFWLDAQNSDLNDSIKIKSAQITAQKDLEDTFRRIQIKLDIYKKISSTLTFSTKIDSISSKVPTTITLSGITMSSSNAEIKGLSSSEVDVSQFISNLKADQTFKTVQLSSVGSAEQNANQITFTIDLTF